MTSWKRVRLGDVATVKHGFAFAGEYFVDTATADVLVTPGNFAIGGGFKLDKPKYYRGPVPPEFVLRPGELVVTMTDLSKMADTLGYGAIVPDTKHFRLLHNQRIGRVILKKSEEVDLRFLSWVLRSDAYRREVVATASGSTVKHTAPSRIEAVHFNLPPCSEQRAIANLLGTLEDKIALNRRTNETLEAMARALFKSWFVDFDPVHAKKAGRAPEGMDAATASLFPSGFDAVGSEVAPKGWRSMQLADVATPLSGGTPSKSDLTLWGGDIPWISPKAMRTIHVYESDANVTTKALGNGTRLAACGATLVMVRGMGLHEEVRMSQAACDVAFNQDVKALVPQGIHPTLLLFALLDAQADLLSRVESSGHGTGRLPSDILMAHPVVLPSEERQLELAQSFDGWNEKMKAARIQSDSLTSLRDALLPKLLTGELRVPEAERIVGKAV